ncbi:MAG: hypothetical protein HPY55_06680 [Firmicutes bacterium]|nr:hypothetical protein [Bacillota bacterium]
MSKNEIKAELIRRGIPFAEIADECGVTLSAVSQVLRRSPSYRCNDRIRLAIARRLGLTVEQVFGPAASRGRSAKSTS